MTINAAKIDPLRLISPKNYVRLRCRFNIALVYKQLTATEADRHDFLAQPATVNAWYMVSACPLFVIHLFTYY